MVVPQHKIDLESYESGISRRGYLVELEGRRDLIIPGIECALQFTLKNSPIPLISEYVVKRITSGTIIALEEETEKMAWRFSSDIGVTPVEMASEYHEKLLKAAKRLFKHAPKYMRYLLREGRKPTAQEI